MLNYLMLGLALSTPTSVESLECNMQNKKIESMCFFDEQSTSSWEHTRVYDNSYSSSAVLIDNAYYFENLGYFHGHNDEGTCGIVATQILLGYYDTFYNDNIVDEWYDVNVSQQYKYCNDFTQSPGTDDPNSEYPKKYHNYLADISYSLGDNPIGGMWDDGVIELVTNQMDLSSVEYAPMVLTASSARVLLVSYLKEAINEGRPVLIGGSGHFVVAYGYDETDVYFHTGWGYIAKAPWERFITNNQYDNLFLDIIINETHEHSNNYYSTTLNKYLCPCSCVSYDEEGTYTLEYDDVVSTYRIKFTSAAKIYVSVYTDADYDTSFYDIECDVEYDYYDDLEGISDSEYDYNAHITIWEIEEGGTFEFSLDGYNTAIVTLQINTI